MIFYSISTDFLWTIGGNSRYSQDSSEDFVTGGCIGLITEVLS